MKPIFAILILIIISITTILMKNDWIDRFIGYENYEQCILFKMKNIRSDVAAQQISLACRRMTNISKKTDSCNEIFSLPEKLKVQGNGSVNRDLFFANIYNGLRGRKIAKIEIKISGTSNGRKFQRNLMLNIAKHLMLNGESHLPPLSNGTFMGAIGLEPEAGWTWAINSIYGCNEN